MTDWNPTEPDTAREDGTPVDTEQPVPETPVTPAEPETPSAPSNDGVSAPFNGWSSDGSYRYVPTRPEQPAPEQPTPPAPKQPVAPQPTPRYQSPVYGNGNSYNNPGYPTANGGYVPPQAPQSPYTPPVNNGYTPPVSNGYTSPVSGYTTNPNGGYMPPQPPRQPKKKGNGWIVAIAIVAALGVIGSIVCLGLAAMGYVDSGSSEPTSSQSKSDTDDKENKDAPTLSVSDWDDDDGGLSTREVVNRNLDSTVVLTIYTQSTSFRFGESTLTESGSASGIVMTKDGYIITNWHCVTDENTGEPYDRIDVTLYDGTVYEGAEVIGADESTDLAVIKVKAKNLTPAEFGKSSELAVGDRIVALGNAAGLSWTATQGIVSALARDVYDDTGYAIPCLQVDAAINFGNSGGPLLNKQGLVVGINSAKIAASGYEGLGFSIPIDEAKVIIDSLLKYGRVKGRVAIGITGQTVSSGIYEGFLIATVEDYSPLKNTDAAPGDLIVAVDDVKVTDYSDLRSEIAKHKVGDRVTLTLLRSDGRTGRVSSFEVTTTLIEQK